MAADVVITDRLAPGGLLSRLSPDVEIIDASRASGRRNLTCDEVVALLIDRARAGKTVVRLKGGDPFVFAQGGQEARSCGEAGIAVEIVPGVSSATGARAACVADASLPRPARRSLVLGGSRSGKSLHAERLLDGEDQVTYVATSLADAGDPEWAERIERHRQRRPASWTTMETSDPARLLGQHGAGALLLDSVTTWLAQVMDGCGCWLEVPPDDANLELASSVDSLVRAWASAPARVVAVSDEVGSGIVPATASGRRFREALGELNQRLAQAADEVWLVTAGIPRRLR